LSAKSSPPAAAAPAIPAGAGAAIRAHRERLGQTLEEVARATHIPRQHLQAMEDDRFADLPAGPYASAYLKAVEDHLGAAVPPEAPAHAPPPSAILPLVAVRGIAGLMVLAMALAIGWQVDQRWGTPAAASPAVRVAPVADRHVAVTARRSVELTVAVDGGPPQEQAVAGGDTVRLDAFDRIEVDVPALEAVRVELDGVAIVPQGRQDAPRKLVFVDDGGPG
jgi:hypothetical protein